MEPTRKVMILDDKILEVMEVEECLTKGGYQVVTLSSPHGVLSKIDYEQPEILLVDMQMPRLNMDELLRDLHGSPDYEDLVIVIFSDMKAETLQQFCINNGINGYFCRSMDVTQIAKFLDNFYEI